MNKNLIQNVTMNLVSQLSMTIFTLHNSFKLQLIPVLELGYVALLFVPKNIKKCNKHTKMVTILHEIFTLYM